MAPIPEVPSFLISVGYIVITAVVMRTVRTISLQFVKSWKNRILLLEFLATFELLASCFELGIVIEKHGFFFYGGIMIVLFNYWGTAWQSATASPHPHILDLLQRNVSFKNALGKILAQLLAACFVYNLYVKPIWSFGYRSTHILRIREARCHTHLQVPLQIGVMVEAIATFGFMLALKFFGKRKFSFLSLPLILVAIVYTGLTYTGCYFNPILASTIQFGCEGISVLDHLLVYWVGPILGSAAFTILNKVFDDDRSRENNNKKAV